MFRYYKTTCILTGKISQHMINLTHCSEILLNQNKITFVYPVAKIYGFFGVIIGNESIKSIIKFDTNEIATREFDNIMKCTSDERSTN